MSWWSDVLDTVNGLTNPAANLTPGGNPAAAQVAGGTGILGVVAGIWTNLRDYKMWRSLGWLFLGVVLMLLGVAWWIGPSGARSSPAGIAARQLG